jgi:uncharacterized protein (DUF697 family)
MSKSDVLQPKSTVGRKEAADKIIKRRTIYAAGTGLIPFPIIDVASLLGVQIVMIRDIAEVYGQQENFRRSSVKSFIQTLVGDLAAVGVVSGIKAIPIVGSIIGLATAPVTGAAATYALGKVFTQHFDQGGTLLDFDPVKSRKYFLKAKEEGTIFVEKVAAKNEVGNEVHSLEELNRQKALLLEQVQELEKQMIDARGFTVIEGIGPRTEEALYKAGIKTMKELSETSVADLKKILKEAGYSGIPDTWPEQAKLAAEGKTEELKALQDKIEGGSIKTKTQ